MTGPGRPSTGVRVDIRIPPDTLAYIDFRADRAGVTRAVMIRSALGWWADNAATYDDDMTGWGT